MFSLAWNDAQKCICTDFMKPLAAECDKGKIITYEENLEKETLMCWKTPSPKIKMARTVDEAKVKMMPLLEEFTYGDLQHCFTQWKILMQQCIDSRGSIHWRGQQLSSNNKPLSPPVSLLNKHLVTLVFLLSRAAFPASSSSVATRGEPLSGMPAELYIFQTTNPKQDTALVNCMHNLEQNKVWSGSLVLTQHCDLSQTLG